MIRVMLLGLALVALGACSSKYPDYEDMETQPYYSNMRNSFQRSPPSRVSFQSLDGIGATDRPRVGARRRHSAIVVQPLPNATAAPTPLIQNGG
ncbi:hypothetical protein FFK22_019255 [Mycobacterium sp. KBS0706]|uniref:hypothetical protein n=1 Tax=Mycobacterium sp. KBS0706 TaxID=2578109 RepID=UPI00110FAF1B|nr:hypothetical protein [Mycobacterium sp. KBS0706]TSD87030.1 hypothetical protein FFK22_019255 [Mycobacterium sp. KBS0706]